MKVFLMIALCTLIFPVSSMAEDRESIRDYYNRIDKSRQHDDDDFNEYKSPFDAPKRDKDDPWNVPKEHKDDRFRSSGRAPKPIELHNGMNPYGRGTSSEEVLRRNMSTY
jgi:hypothetical protein